MSTKIESESLPEPTSGEPPGTVSQTVSYWDTDGNQVALVHQYLRADRTIGASGRPDPKLVRHNGTMYGEELLRSKRKA